MTVVLYDLAGAEDDRRISPFCWRTRMALAHKGLAVETIPWRLADKHLIAPYGAKAVPLIIDGTTSVHESWDIAVYLDSKHPNRPLFDSQQAQAYAFGFHHWVESTLHPLVVPLILGDVFHHLHERDRGVFRATRERAFKKPLESVMDRSEEAMGRLKGALAPVRRTLRQNAFLAGSAPAYADYILFGMFQWARSCSPLRLLTSADDPIVPWLGKMLRLFDGLGANARGYDTLPIGSVETWSSPEVRSQT